MLLEPNPNTPPASGTVANLSRSLAPGTRLQGGRYVIKKVLGQGGMGAALLATDIRLDSKPVVIKELISDNVDPVKVQDDVRNFKREVALLAHIDHPLVPSVTDHFQEGTRYFMVQEYVEGENLEERLEHTKQPMKEREALIFASEVLDILDYLSLQSPPIVHRDIKPANVIIGAKDKRAHLVDFGIARAEVARNAQRKQTSALGTPGYAPPEQYQGNADPRSDLYALAATLHHVLTNRDPRDHPPFTYPPVRTLNPQLSPEIERVLEHALINDSKLRYQSAALMKQDIDNILLQRFGVSGNLSSTYTLGTSGPMAALGSSPLGNTPTLANVTNQPTLRQINTPVSLPLNVPPPPQAGQSGASYPYFTSGSYPPVLPQQQQPQPARRTSPWLIALIVILLLLLVSGGGFAVANALHTSSLFKGSATVTTGGVTGNGIGVTKVGNENIGISDGTFAFDTQRLDGSLKQQAALQLKQHSNDINPVISLLSQATSQDSNDAEALIYREDLQIVNSGSPYVTVVVGTMLSGDNAILSVGRDDLQGAYIAQKEFNDGSKLHGGVKVRLLVASTGSQSSYTNQVAQQVVQLAKSDPTFVGVMGWPYSSRSVNAVPVLSKAHIPMVSQTASSDALTNVSPYFFRVAPSNQSEAIAGAQYAEQNLHVKNAALFYDPADAYSQSLAQDFKQKFTADGNSIAVEEKYTVGKPDTLPAALQDALQHNPDSIYFSGYSNDVSTLLVDLPAGNMPVMGGDALYELGGYTSSARPSFSRLRFTAFSYPDEWDILGLGGQKPPFFAEYPAAFSGGKTGYGFTRADNDAVLSYDAIVALLKGCDNALSTGKNTITPDDLLQGLRQITKGHAFQGISGQIAFGADGNPDQKAIVILHVSPEGFIQMEPVTSGQFLVK
ncbi:MAG TPA: bifunctional serine/threonine-protein kinase/ABC transporter substrate-binding protein [Ktedonosporobacter sp.]|nr:bifunctional serine/threonine-protein kinase/ABC transporter substrate-binding protein [Ktedonosporobacter sp.]